jgi:ArsR family transcriptional regulator, arsenate/arsenite/antimonite-responsive transcriptional repressor
MAAELTVPRLKALAHPIRLGMMRRLAEEPEVCACDLGEAFGVSQPTVSQHLRVLRETGLVRTRRQGTQICYSADPGALAEVEAALAALRPRPAARAAAAS